MNPPRWLEQLGTHLRASKDHWLHSLEASQPNAQRPIRCGAGLSPQILPKTACEAARSAPPACIDGLTFTFTCHNL